MASRLLIRLVGTEIQVTTSQILILDLPLADNHLLLCVLRIYIYLSGDEEKLRHALKHLPPKAVNHVFPHPVSATALHVATQNNSYELVKALLEVPADTGARVSTSHCLHGLMDCGISNFTHTHTHTLTTNINQSII